MVIADVDPRITVTHVMNWMAPRIIRSVAAELVERVQDIVNR
jgi:hypothetical protein